MEMSLRTLTCLKLTKLNIFIVYASQVLSGAE